MSADTLAPHPVCAEVAALVAHLTCLERAAVAPDTPAEALRKIRERISEHRVALTLLGADLLRGAE